jgi:hypothetical protein
VLIATPAIAEQAEVCRLAITLANTRWQALPREVERVYVGPDDRTWYVVQRTGPALSIPAIKRHIEREFRQKSPQVSGVKLTLFEPSGRVWFYSPADSALLGYDGKEWIEYAIADRGVWPYGLCLTRGGCTLGAVNRYAGGAAWFVGNHGVYRFDGKTWAHQRIAGDDPRARQSAQLAISSDGQAAAACCFGDRSIWLFRNGRWDVQPVQVSRSVIDLAMSDARTLWYVDTDGLQRMSLSAEEKVREKLLALADDSEEVWQRAAAELKAMGPAIGPQCEKVLREFPAAQQDRRLKLQYRLRLALKSGEIPPLTAGQPRVTSFGAARVYWPCRMFQDHAGRVYVAAKQIEDDRSRTGPGLAILDANRARILWEKDGEKPLPGLGSLEGSPIASAAGNQLWWPTTASEGQILLLDLGRDKIVDTARLPNRLWLEAVGNDGRLFIRVSSRSFTSPEALMVYTPDAPDARTALPAVGSPLKNSAFAIADDGAVWAVHPDQGLVRFHNRQWQRLAEQPEGYIRAMLAGTDGVVAVRAGVGHYLSDTLFYRGNQKIIACTLDSLTKRAGDVLKKAFGANSPAFAGRWRQNPGWQFVADRQGNIWSADESGNFVVQSGDQLLSPTTEPLIDNGVLQVRISCLMPVGDGRKVYAADFERNLAFLGEVENSRLRFTPMPPIQGPSRLCTMRDTDGCLWILAGSGSSDGSGGRVASPTIFRIGHEGVVEKLEMNARPCLVDRAGNVWLGHVSRDSTPSCSVWRQGKLVQDIAIPELDSGMFLVSDRPGSVYALTCMGLQHLVADAPNFDHYRLDKVYSIDDVVGEITALEYSKLGCLLLAARTTSPQSFSLYTVALPNPDNSADVMR